jgi:hypothetical protein
MLAGPGCVCGIDDDGGACVSVCVLVPACVFVCICPQIPLTTMFGYSTDLRSATQGKGEFTMEYARHAPLSAAEAERVIAEGRKARAAAS